MHSGDWPAQKSHVSPGKVEQHTRARAALSAGAGEWKEWAHFPRVYIEIFVL